MDGLPRVSVRDDDFGINSAGLMITETTITGFTLFDPAGSPEFYRARKALHYSNSIDDYVRIMLDGNNGGYANDWLLGDNKKGEIALFELGLKEHSVRRTRDGYFVGSNFPVDPKLTATETTFDVTKADSSPNARRARWEQLMAAHKGKIDLALAERLETDVFDVIAGKAGAWAGSRWRTSWASRGCWPARGRRPASTAACTTGRGPGGSCNYSCRARPASATRSTTSPS